MHAMLLTQDYSCMVAMRRRLTPRLIPGPQRWRVGPGSYAFAPGAQIVVRDEVLVPTATVFAADLLALTGVRVGWRLGGVARPGDIVLGIGPAHGGAEGYRLTVSSTLDVRGAEAGVFYGTRTISQLLHQGWAIPGGTVEDWPAYPERGLMLDAGRKYFSLSFLRKQIRELAYLKLNYLHLHLSDNLGFRLESATHPEVTSEQHYTKAKVRELIEYAARHHVEVVPEIDVPGHMGAILARHPELRLAGRPGCIDLSKPDSYALVEDLLTEFLPLFPSRYWHIGADEYPGDRDAFRRFVDWADGLVRSAGKTTRMWNDGLKPGVTVNPDVVVEHWSAGGRTPWRGPARSPRELVAAGHLVQNAAFTPTYLTSGGVAALVSVPPWLMYDAWNPTVFVDGTRVREGNLGALVHVWCDDPSARTEEEIAAAVFPRLRVLAQHTWGSPKIAPLYLLFRRVINAVGPAPG